MPNRILRDFTDSDKVNKLDVNTERFYVRLMMKADDYGCFHADTRLLKASLFPLIIEQVKDADISRWITECIKNELVILYEATGKKYLQIKNFGQRLDRAKNKFPLPDNQSVTIITNDPLSIDNDIRPETESEAESESEKKPKQKYRENVSLFVFEYENLTAQLGQRITDLCLDKLNSYKGAKGKRYKSDYQAIHSWVIRAVKQENPAVSTKSEMVY